ncbi:MAG: NAD(P)-dependent oxidoreductase [Acidimicrobiia bacterium]|nr:NAD(P)-dependent oxidoreductase [Acidimicrobiia bacterium]
MTGPPAARTNPIGFIGLGVMGEPMCRNLLAKGRWPVVVHDVRPEPVERLAAAGATPARSVADVVAAADVIALSLPGGPELEAVVAGDGGVLTALRGGQLVVDHSTAPPLLTKDLAERCRAVGADYCDAPIARTRQAAHDGTLSIMVGGTSESFERLGPILATMATDVIHCGDVGSGQVTKILNNMMLFQNVRAIAEAHAIATGLLDTIDLDLDRVFAAIAGASGGSFALRNHGMTAMFRDSYPTESFSTTYALKDLGYALDLASEVGVDAVGAVTVGELLRAARDAGYTDEYWPVLRRLL